jgi:hypothetical protein
MKAVFIALIVVLLTAGCGHALSRADVTGTWRAGGGTFFLEFAPQGTWHEWHVQGGKIQALNHGTYTVKGGHLALLTFQHSPSKGSLGSAGLTIVDADGATSLWVKEK